MNDGKIISKYRDEYHDFINNKIMPTVNETLFDNEQVELSAYDETLVEIKQSHTVRDEKTRNTQNIGKTIQYVLHAWYSKVYGSYGASNRPIEVEVSNKPFLGFIAVCIDKDMHNYKNFATTKEELFKYLRGFIDDKRYINQRRAAFEPSKFPEMSVWRQSKYYEFVDSQFKQKLFKDDLPYKFIDGIPVEKSPDEESDVKVNIRSIDLKQQFISFHIEGHKKPYVYTSSSKYYKSISDSNASKIENNNPYFMFILRCLNKDEKRHDRVQYKEFSQQELSTYFDGFISNDKYKNEYDVTFVPVEVNPGIDHSLKEKYDKFIDNKLKYQTKDSVRILSTDEHGALLLSPYHPSTRWDDYNPENAFIPENEFIDYKNNHGMHKEVKEVPSDDPNFKFILGCLSHNKTEKVSQSFKTKEGLFQYLKGLIFNQQCKEDYLNNFDPKNAYLPIIGQSGDSGLPALPGSSNNAISTTSPSVMHQAVFFTWLAYMLSPIFSPIFNYISNKISDASDEKERERLNGKPSSSITEVEEKQLGEEGITK